MKTSKGRPKQSKWRRFGGRHNGCLKISKQGQIEILGHLARKEDIADFCTELQAALLTEWELSTSVRGAQGSAAFAQGGLFSEMSEAVDFSAIPELKPASLAPLWKKKPA